MTINYIVIESKVKSINDAAVKAEEVNENISHNIDIKKNTVALSRLNAGEKEIYNIQNTNRIEDGIKNAYLFGENVLKFLSKIESAHDEDINSVKWHSKKNVLVTAGDDALIKIWAFENLNQNCDLSDHLETISQSSEHKGIDTRLSKKMSKLDTGSNESDLELK